MDDFATVKQGSLEFEVCRGFPAGAIHCFTTRYGGVSEGYLASLNLGLNRGDSRENVLQNYEILGNALGFSVEDLVFTRQTHTDLVERVGRSNRGEGLFRPVLPERDGLITNEPGVALAIFSADCTPVLFFDPVRRVVGGCHAGWRGMAKGIPAKTVAAMEREYGCKPEDIYAAIGPCIGSCCFETSEDVPNAMKDALGQAADAAISQSGEKYRVDLKKLAKIWLERAGVRQIFTSPDCTACLPDKYWSHRVTHGERGSQAAIIMLK